MSDPTEDRMPFDVAHPALSFLVDVSDMPEPPPERLPRLLGWTVLLQPWSPPKKTVGGIFLPDQVADANEHLTYLFKVVALGPLAFTHPRLCGGVRRGWRSEKVDDHGNSEWSEHDWTDFAAGVATPLVGDWVIVRKYAGIQLELEGVPLKLCNDDDILAVVDSPAGWKVYI